MKILKSQHVFEWVDEADIADVVSARLNRHDWATVVTALLNRYPNPINPGVVACDVIARTLSASGLLHSHRLLTANWGFAPALKGLFKMIDYGYASEHSTIDARQGRMITRTRNLVLNRFIHIEERLEYSRLSSDTSKTLLQQEVTIDVQKLPLADLLETMIGETMCTNSKKVWEKRIQQDAHRLDPLSQDQMAIEWMINRMRTSTILPE